MFQLHATQLLWVAVACALTGILLSGSAAKKSTTVASNVLNLVRTLLFAIAIAAMLAAVLTVVLTSFRVSSMNSDALDVLNQRLRHYHQIAERWTWVMLALTGAAILSAAILGWFTLKRMHVKRFARLAVSVNAVKVVLAVITSGSFVAGNQVRRNDSEIARVNSAIRTLTEVQYATFVKVTTFVQREVIAASMDTAKTANMTSAGSALAAVFNAYQEIAEYLPRKSPSTKSPATGRPEFDAGLSIDAARQIAGEYDAANAKRVRQDLTEEIAKVAFDMNASDAVREHLLKLGNPVVSEVIATVLDPVLIEPIRRIAQEISIEVLKKRLNPDSIKERIQPAAKRISDALGPRLSDTVARTTRMDVNSLGVPIWSEVRRFLSHAVADGLRNKDEETRAAARQSVNDFARTWAAANTLFYGRDLRTYGAEAMFGEYLHANPSYAALWGYAVISSTPSRYSAQLATIAQEDFLQSSKLKLVRRALARATAGDGDAIEALKKLGFNDKAIGFGAMNDAQIARQLFKVHGPYPVDGYMLYALNW
jgi:hypothetical protein